MQIIQYLYDYVIHIIKIGIHHINPVSDKYSSLYRI
jgi:hypothetical protein